MVQLVGLMVIHSSSFLVAINVMVAFALLFSMVLDMFCYMAKKMFSQKILNILICKLKRNSKPIVLLLNGLQVNWRKKRKRNLLFLIDSPPEIFVSRLQRNYIASREKTIKIIEKEKRIEKTSCFSNINDKDTKLNTSNQVPLIQDN